MTVSKRNRLIVIGLALLVLLVIVFFTIFDRDSEPSGETSVPPAATADGLGVSADIEIQELPDGLLVSAPPEAAPVGRTDAQQIAEIFSVRYGSYSNQGSYRNLVDLLPIMTPAFRARTEVFLASADEAGPAPVYEGYTASKISAAELTYDEQAGSARYEIRLQQAKVTGSAEPEILYPVLRISLRKIAEDWRVDDATWVR